MATITTIQYEGAFEHDARTALNLNFTNVNAQLAVLAAGTFAAGIAVTGNATVSGTLGVTGAATLSSTLAVTGAVTPTAGIVQVSAAKHFYTPGGAPGAQTTGTDTAGVNGTFWISELFVPFNTTITGLSYLIGSVGGTDKVVVALFSAAGAVLANSAVDSSKTVGTAAGFQRVDFLTPYAAAGPAKFYVGVQYNGATAKIRTQAGGDHETTSISQTFNTLVAITPPTTFTVSVGPIVMTY